MRIAGFDPGLVMGWATYMAGGIPEYHWGSFKLDYDHPLASLETVLLTLLNFIRPATVWIEKPVGLGYRAMAANSQKVAILAKWAGEDGMVKMVAPTIVKKFATGSGKATKEQMIDAARHRWGWLVKNEHEADALWVLEYGKTQEQKAI